jgi:hypothetical protein
MPTTDDLKQSKYFGKADVANGPVKAVIASWAKEEVGSDKDIQFVVHFQGDVKPLILKPTNGDRIKAVTGTGDLDKWAGKEITLYLEPNVEFQGKLVGGVRVAVPGQVLRQQPIDPTPPDDADVPTGSDIPF